VKILIVFYSRTGRTKKASETLASCLRSGGADVAVEELREKKNRSGIVGWFSAGKDALFKKRTEIEPIGVNVKEFDIVLIGTPVWAFTATPAVSCFLERHGTEIKKVAFFCTMRSSGDIGAFKRMEQLSGKTPIASLSLIDKFVWNNDEANFLTKVKEFANSVLKA